MPIKQGEVLGVQIWAPDQNSIISQLKLNKNAWPGTEIIGVNPQGHLVRLSEFRQGAPVVPIQQTKLTDIWKIILERIRENPNWKDPLPVRGTDQTLIRDQVLQILDLQPGMIPVEVGRIAQLVEREWHLVRWIRITEKPLEAVNPQRAVQPLRNAPGIATPTSGEGAEAGITWAVFILTLASHETFLGPVGTERKTIISAATTTAGGVPSELVGGPTAVTSTDLRTHLPTSPKRVLFTGSSHGSNTTLLNSDGLPVIPVLSNTDTDFSTVVNNRVFHLFACLTDAILASSCVSSGALAYFGYTGLVNQIKDELGTMHLEWDQAVGRCDAAVDQSLLKKRSFHDALVDFENAVINEPVFKTLAQSRLSDDHISLNNLVSTVCQLRLRTKAPNKTLFSPASP